MRIWGTLLILSLGLVHSSLSGQDIDSLMQALEDNSDSQQEIYILEQIASYYHGVDIEKSLYYNQILIDSAKSLPDSLIWAKTLNRYGIVMNELGNYNAAIYHHLEAIIINQLLGNQQNEAVNYINIGFIYGRLNEYDRMIEYSLKALEFFEANPEIRVSTRALIYGNLGYAYSQIKDAENSLAYIEKAMRINRELNNMESLSLNYVTLGEVKIFQGDTIGGIESIKKCIKIRYEIDIPLDLAMRFLRLSEVYLAQSKFETAMQYVDSAIMISNQTKQGAQIVKSLKFKASIYKQLSNFESAYLLIEEASQIQDSLRTQADQSNVIVSSLATSSQIQSLESMVNLEKRKSITQRNWIVSLVIASLLILVIAIRNLSLLRAKRKSNLILQEFNNQILNQTKELEKTQDELIVAEKMAVLGRLSASLGHELNTPIAGIKSNIEILEESQRYEFIILRKIYKYFDTELVKAILLLVEVSYLAQRNSYSIGRRRQLKERLLEELQSLYPDKANELAEKFDHLLVYEGVERFDKIIQHELMTDILELVSLTSSRTQAVFTSKQALERVNKITVSLKTYSYKNVDREKTKFNLVKNIDTIFTLYEGMTKGIEITKNYLENCEYTGYPDELSQVWSNLITNSAYELNLQGKITVTMEEKDDFIVVSFEDNGTGIPEEVGEKLFDPFYTTKPEGEGTGLGLGISKKIIERHGGTLTWMNLEKGVRFVATLAKEF